MAESLTHVGLKFRPRGRNTTGDTKSMDMIQKTGKGWMQGPYGTVFCSVGVVLDKQKVFVSPEFLIFNYRRMKYE